MAKVKEMLAKASEVSHPKTLGLQIEAIRNELVEQVNTILSMYGGGIDFNDKAIRSSLESNGMQLPRIGEELDWVQAIMDDRIECKCCNYIIKYMYIDDLHTVLDFLYDFAENDLGIFFPQTIRDILMDGTIGGVKEDEVEYFINKKYIDVCSSSIEEVREAYIYMLGVYEDYLDIAKGCFDPDGDTLSLNTCIGIEIEEVQYDCRGEEISSVKLYPFIDEVYYDEMEDDFSFLVDDVEHHLSELSFSNRMDVIECVIDTAKANYENGK